jgi:hypothetical protein
MITDVDVYEFDPGDRDMKGQQAKIGAPDEW